MQIKSRITVLAVATMLALPVAGVVSASYVGSGSQATNVSTTEGNENVAYAFRSSWG
jgi:hypothetical protein